jgi:hypothetical protein
MYVDLQVGSSVRSQQSAASRTPPLYWAKSEVAMTPVATGPISATHVLGAVSPGKYTFLHAVMCAPVYQPSCYLQFLAKILYEY